MTTITFHERVLTGPEEQRLARTIEAGLLARQALESGAPPAGASAQELRVLSRLGEEAFERFVSANLRLVSHVSNRSAARWSLDPDELFQEGVLGLIEAVRRYDHARGARFATFALPWIRMRVGESAVTRAGGIGLPASRARAWVQVVAIRNDLIGRSGRSPAVDEIARRAGRPVEQVNALLRYVPPVRVADPEHAGAVAAPTLDDDWDRLGDLLGLLHRQEREIIEALYGVRRAALSHEQVAGRLGLSTSTVRRRERAALDRLRHLHRTADVA